MPIIDSVYIALFLIVVVFLVLFCLYLSMKIFSFLIGKFEKSVRPSDESV